jgi:hypothetical protein
MQIIQLLGDTLCVAMHYGKIKVYRAFWTHGKGEKRTASQTHDSILHNQGPFVVHFLSHARQKTAHGKKKTNW